MRINRWVCFHHNYSKHEHTYNLLVIIIGITDLSSVGHTFCKRGHFLGG